MTTLGIALEATYASIGRALISCQILEASFYPLFVLVKETASPSDSGDEVFVTPKDFKNPMRGALTLLSERQLITPELFSEFDAFIDLRHLLVHRYVSKFGLPADDDVEGMGLLRTLAEDVRKKADALSRRLALSALAFNTDPVRIFLSASNQPPMAEAVATAARTLSPSTSRTPFEHPIRAKDSASEE